MKFLIKTFFRIILIVITIGVIYYYRESWADFINPPKPCSKPITYSIGTFDTKFGITKEEFVRDIEKAGSVWEKATGKNLFEYSETGTLVINLEYDYRQQTTDQLKEAGAAISDDRSTYNTLKEKYTSENQTYTSRKKILEQNLQEYNNQKTAYEQQVDYWNSHGGAPKSEYQTLQNQKNDLRQQGLVINKESDELSVLNKELNATITALNEVAKKLNIKVTDYNTIGTSTGEEFREGEYVSDEKGIRINVYQFGDNAKLIRLLEHELGHALGLDHVEDREAIMYRLNSSTNQNPTTADTKELQRVCEQIK